MRIKVLLFTVLIAISFSGNQLEAQNKVPQLSTEFSGDSLDGFDEDEVRTTALMDGITGSAYTTMLEIRKRLFIYKKYNFHYYLEKESGDYFNSNYTLPGTLIGKALGGNANINAAPCINEGFETGNINGWVCTQGVNTSACVYPVTNNTITFPNASYITTSVTPFTDPIFGVTIPNSPFTGSVVAKINDHLISFAPAVKLAQTFPVTNSNFLYEFAYVAMMATQHTCCQQPFMRVSVRDNVGNLLSCPLFTFAPPPPSGPICSSSGVTWAAQQTVTTTQGTYLARRNPTWQKYSIDLTNYIGTNVSIEVVVADCSPTGHFGYAYFDSNCSELGFNLATSSGTSFVTAPTQTVNITGLCGTTATITAPSGLGPYLWNGPSGSGVTSNTNQTISTSVAGLYTISMNPPGSCVPINRVINLNFAPPTTVVATPTAICAAGSSTTATLSASGALSYTWNPGNIISSNTVVSPTVTTIYSLTAVSGTCIGNYTQQITVNPTPTVIVSNPSGSVCASTNATITATGAGVGGSYLWQPGAISGSAAVVSPSANTVYTAIATSSSGCVGTETTIVGVSSTPSTGVVAFPALTGSVCSGTPVNVLCYGALSYTINPSGVTTSNFATLTPTITTNYTVLGAIGACTSTAAITISVDPGPTMTVTGTPSLTCPYTSGSLTALAPTSLGFTWTPPGATYGGTSSTHVVTPTLTTTYSVQGINAAGCRSTYTIAQVVSPVPNITITASSPSICVGSTVSYTASGGSTYTWNPGNLNTAAVTFTPSSSTTYTVISSNGTCTSSATSSVLVVPLPTVSALASPTVICAGNSTTLTANGANNYTWQPGGSTSSLVAVSPSVNTVYTLTGNSAGCGSTATVAVTVNPNPTVGVVASPTAICPGFSSTLTPNGATTYTLNGLFITGFSPFVITPPSTTTYTMSGTNAFGCTSSTTLSMLVNPTPTVILTASTPSVCFGSASTLSATGAASYTWLPGGISGPNVTVTPTITSTYTANATSSAGCAGSNTITIIVVPIPSISATASPTTICAGASATLTGNGGTSYSWNPGGLTGVNVTVNPTLTTVYTVTGSLAGCTSTSTLSLVVNPLPTITAVASPTAICPGGSSTLTATSSAVAYTWNPGGFTGGSISVNPASTTIYTVSGITASGCTSTRTVQLVVNPVPNVSVTASSASICAGNSTTLTGSGATSYSWSPGSLVGTAVSVSPSVTTTYTVIGANAFGCTGQQTITILVVPLPTVGATATPTAVCVGGSVSLSGTGATSYTWNPGGLAGANVTVSPTITTTYTLSGNSAGCSSNTVVLVTVNPLPNLTAIATPTAICPTASAVLSATGAVTYTWNPGALNGSTVSVSPASTTLYTVSGTSAAGCVGSRTVNLVVNPTPSIAISPSTFSICSGGFVTLNATGGSTYTWSPGGTNGSSLSASPTITTVYTVNATSTLGCPGQATASVFVSPIPVVVAVSNPTSVCPGSSATLSATGANTYTWSTGTIASSLVVTPTTTTTYSVVGNNGICTSTVTTITVTVNAVPSITAIATPTAICPGNSAVLSAVGASSYTWQPGNLSGPSATVSPTSTTIYTVTGVNAAGCSATRTVSVFLNPVPTVTASATSPTICAGTSDTLVASGASVYVWNPGGLTGFSVAVTPTVTTIYTVTGTNSLGCSAQTTVQIIVVPNPTISASANPTAICVGGSSTLTAIGASSFVWSTSSTNTSIVVSPSVTTSYSVVGITGACPSNTAVVTVTVNNGPALTATASPANICPGNSSTLIVSGGVSYTWQPGSLSGSNPVVTPTSTTVYTVTGASAFGCTSIATTTVTLSPAASITAAVNPTTICAGQSSTLIALGGFTYTWNPGNIVATNVTITPASTTVYTLTGANAFGCVAQSTVQISVTPNPTVTASTSNASICVGQTAVLTASGAATYTWNPGNLVGAAVTVTPGANTSYTVTGTSGGCDASAIVNVTVNSLPSLTLATTATAVCPAGSATLSGLGATSFTWNPGGLTGSAVVVNPSSSTVYTASGANGAGCIANSTISITVNPNPTVSASLSTPTICAGQSSSLIANGATSYTWNPGALTGNSISINPTSNTTYTVTGGSLGCTSTATTQIVVNALPVITATASPASICTGNTSTLSANGGVSYNWTPGNLSGSSVTVSPTSNTPYIVTGTNALGCSNTATVIVTVNSVPSLSISSTSNTLCGGSSATLTASGTLSYSWTPGGSTSSVIVVNPTSTTVYTVFGSNGFGCSSSLVYTLVVTPTPTIVASASSSIICAGFTTAISATGANSYTWNPGALNGSLQVVSPSVTTVYTVSGDNNGCVALQTVTVTVNPLPVVTASANPSPICIGLTTTLSAGGAVSYTWLPMATIGATVTDSPTANTTYTVFGLDAAGCPNFAVVSVSVLPTPTVSISASSASVCIGSSATLTANGAANYTWSPGATTGSVLVVNPTTATTYTLLGDNGGCNNSTTVSVGVNPLPVVSAAASPTSLCAGLPVSLTGTGALNYTWSPGALTGSSTTDNPTTSTTYTLDGEDANGCIGQAFVTVSVNPLPTLTLTASQLTVCQGSSVSIAAAGANNYTWTPLGVNTVSVTDTPSATTIYTVNGEDANTCVGTETIQIAVVPIPTIALSPLNLSVCAGSPATLTATGASNYTWLPSSTNGSVSVENPTITSTYTVIGDNGGNCPSTTTVSVFVNPLPANLTATVSGTITCAAPTVTLSGNSSNTAVSYSWSGPSSFTSTSQTPTTNVWGDYTLTVTDNNTGCVATITVNVPTDNSIPTVTATASGSINCANPTVTITAVNTTTLPGYSWTGPSGFTSTLVSTTVSVAGDYTVVVTDLNSSCTATSIVSIGIHTNVAITASIAPATCSNGVSNNDGSIIVSNFGTLDKFDLVSGSTYTGTATYTSATIIPTTGIITNNLANPTNTVAFTIRLFDDQGCTKDTTLILVPVDCVPKVLGIAKAVSTPTTNTDGTYDVSYEVVVKNFDTAILRNVSLTENLNNTFPLPVTFTVTGAPVITSANSSLTINSGFDGLTQTNLLTPASSSLAAGKSDTIRFVVKVKTQSNFGPFKNTVTGLALTSASVTVADSSNAGYATDPDNDNNPTDNNSPTVISFTPHLFFGLTKVGAYTKLDNNTYDISYTVSVHNFGNDTLRNVVVKDSLFGAVIKAPSTYTIRTAPAADGNLIANANYDGKTDVDLLIAGLSKMAPGVTSNIVFVINVDTYSATTETEIRNSAFGRALEISPNFTANVSDTSNNGTNPDTNNNGVWNETVDNVPTILVLPPAAAAPTPTLFIPEGFSPNSDGINDVFVIQGLPTNGENSITIFNRWGNRVYFHSNYNNAWDGHPNIAGTLGKDKLPQGTYYYILDIKGSGLKPITGYIVLQY
jgi:gliding motility-associated-like protein